jgi:type IV secretory pathway VirJ component
MNARSVLALLAALALSPAALAQQDISHGRFKDVALYRPQGEVKSVVLFLSGDGGWNQGVTGMAQALVDQGAMVVGISVPQVVKSLEMDQDRCVYPAGDIENLSHYLQGYARLPTYMTPVLVGYSSGASLAYALLAQAPEGTFSGALSLGFCPDLKINKPLCKGEDLRSVPRKDGKGFDMLPDSKLHAPWTALQGEQDQVCDAKATQAFVSKVPGASLVMLPQVGHGYSVPKNWMPQYLAAYRTLTAQRAAAVTPAPPASLSDLPVVEVPASGDGDLFAVLLSGDGGWAGLDKDLAAAMSAQGIPVVGLDSLRYFWTARTPAGLAGDLDRVMRHYAAQWRKSRAVLVGYSQGADVLPFAVNRLPPGTKPMVAQTVMIGLSDKAAFEFHLGNWVGLGGDGEPTLPEVEKLDAATALCLYGQDDRESLCPKVPNTHVFAQALPGGHHFNGAYDQLARTILARIKAR